MCACVLRSAWRKASARGAPPPQEIMGALAPRSGFFSGFRVHFPAQNAFPFAKFALGFGLDLLGFPWIRSSKSLLRSISQQPARWLAAGLRIRGFDWISMDLLGLRWFWSDFRGFLKNALR